MQLCLSITPLRRRFRVIFHCRADADAADIATLCCYFRCRQPLPLIVFRADIFFAIFAIICHYADACRVRRLLRRFFRCR